jgi:hypothetical protein
MPRHPRIHAANLLYHPVRAKIAQSPGDWEWSGHYEYAHQTARHLIDLGLVKEIFGEGKKGYDKYITFLEDGGGKKYQKEYHPKDIEPFVGDERFVENLSFIKIEKTRKEHDLEKILKEISKEKKIKAELIKGKTRIKEVSEARTEFIRRSILEYGNSQALVGRYLQCDEGYISKVIKNKAS